MEGPGPGPGPDGGGDQGKAEAKGEPTFHLQICYSEPIPFLLCATGRRGGELVPALDQ